MNSQQTAMSTPISNLPIKTVTDTNNDIDDPMIQTVLKEFEEEVPSTQKIEMSVQNLQSNNQVQQQLSSMQTHQTIQCPQNITPNSLNIPLNSHNIQTPPNMNIQQSMYQNNEILSQGYSGQYNQSSYQKTQNMLYNDLSNDNLNYNKIKQNDSYIDFEIIKKTCILSIIIILLQTTNITNIILFYLPDKFQSFFKDKEIILFSILLFVMIYVLFYFKII